MNSLNQSKYTHVKALLEFIRTLTRLKIVSPYADDWCKDIELHKQNVHDFIKKYYIGE